MQAKFLCTVCIRRTSRRPRRRRQVSGLGGVGRDVFCLDLPVFPLVVPCLAMRSRSSPLRVKAREGASLDVRRASCIVRDALALTKTPNPLAVFDPLAPGWLGLKDLGSFSAPTPVVIKTPVDPSPPCVAFHEHSISPARLRIASRPHAPTATLRDNGGPALARIAQGQDQGPHARQPPGNRLSHYAPRHSAPLGSAIRSDAW
jgi:hypothetical protein